MTMKKPSDYDFTSIGILTPTRQKYAKLAKRYKIKIYQLAELLISEHLEGFKEKKIKVRPEDIDDKDRKIFKEFDKL